MASGFLTLPDGRCLAVHWAAHDAVLRAIAEALVGVTEASELREWILRTLPGPDDVEELGYGAWFRTRDGKNIRKVVDLRLLPAEWQRMFCDAAKRAAAANPTWSLMELDDMVRRYERGEPPLSKTHLRVVSPLHPDAHDRY